MTGKLKFGSLQWGTFNDLKDRNARNSGSRRRGTSQSYLQAALEKAFSRHGLTSKNQFYGIIINSRSMLGAPYAKRGPLLTDFTLGTGATQSAAGTIDNRAFKAYIPELEPRPFPLSPDDPVIYTFPDLYMSTELEEILGVDSNLAVGTLAIIEYANLDYLLDPMIIGYDAQLWINFEGTSTDKKLWATSNTGVVGGAAYGRVGSGAGIIAGQSTVNGCSELAATYQSFLPGQPDHVSVSTYRGQGVVYSWEQLKQLVPVIKPLLTVLAKAESGRKKYAAANRVPNPSNINGKRLKDLADVVYGDNNSKKLGRATPDDGSTSTIAKIIEAQQWPKDDPKRTGEFLFATGRYQIIPKTMIRAVAAIGEKTVGGARHIKEQIYNAENQDALGIHLMFNNRPRIGHYFRGNHNSALDAAQSMAYEWAGVPMQYAEFHKDYPIDVNNKKTGNGNLVRCQSWYESDATRAPNHAKASIVSEILSTVEKVRRNIDGNQTVVEILANPAPKV